MVNEDDVLPDCPPDMAHMRPTYRDLRQALAQIKELREENERLRAPLRPSLEVLQRMANGLDPFDRGRFQAAMAALPHETPKLTATMNHNTYQMMFMRVRLAPRSPCAALRHPRPARLQEWKYAPHSYS